MKNVKEPAPHEKAAQIEKEAVRALSVDEVEEALTKSTYGGEKKPTDDIIVVPDGTPYDIIETLPEHRRYIKELEGDKEILKTECLDLREQVAELEKVLVKVRQENKDLTKTISKMKYAHDEEVRALEDDLAEAKILAKKKNEYADALDEDSVAFGKIRSVAAAIAGMADSIQSLAYMVQDETEGRE